MQDKNQSKIHQLLNKLNGVQIVLVLILLVTLSVVIGWQLRSGEVEDIRVDLLTCTLLRVTGG